MAVNKTDAKKPAAPAKKVKTFGFITVDKNNYSKNITELVAGGATVVTITTNPQLYNSFDVHYFKLQ